MRSSRVFAWLVVSLAGGMVTLFLVSETRWPHITTVAFWVLVLAAAELLPVSLGFGTQATMGFPIHLALVIVFRNEPGIAMAIAALAAMDLREFTHVIPPHKAFFNRAVMALSVGGASAPIIAYGRDPLSTPFGGIAIAAGAIAYLIVNLSLLGMAVHLERGLPPSSMIRSFIPKPVSGFVISYVLLTCLGVVTAVADDALGKWAVAAILIPLLFARLSILGARTQQELSERLQKQQQELLSATERVFQERENERKRIAEDIHDSSLQSLAAAAYGSGNALEFLDAGHLDRARAAMAGARDAVDGAIVRLRESLVDLRKSAVEEGGLMVTINKFADQISVLWGAEVRIEGTVEHEPPVPVALAAFQILQEGLTNAVKHSQGSEIAVKIQEHDSMVHILVEDHGPGFDTSAEVGEDHVGMRLMKERAARVGGRIELDSKPGAGTRLEAILPAGVAQ